MARALPPDRPVAKDIRKLLPALQFLRPYSAAIVVAVLALLLTAAVSLAAGQGLRLIVDEGFAAGSPEQLDGYILLTLGAVVLLAAGTFARHYTVSWLGERVAADLQKAVFNRVLELHPSYFETNSPGEIQSRITTDASLIQTVIGSSASIALRNFLMFSGGVAWLFLTNVKLSLIVAAAVPLVIGPILFFGRRVRKLSRTAQDRIADAGAYVSETLGAIKTVQAFNHETQDRAIFSRRVEDSFTAALHRIRQRSFLIVFVILLVFGAIAVMLWSGGHDVLAGKITAGELAAFAFYAVIVASSVGAISEVIGDLQRAAGATERLMELLAAESKIAAPENPRTLPEKSPGALQLRGVRFCYPSRPDTLALEDINLAVAPGETVALVGRSGAGKSTLFELLLRFHDPAAGEIVFDGVDLRELDPRELRRRLAIVPQQPALFSGTVRENIRYSRPEASDEEVRAAAHAAYADEFIQELPDGYDSHLGELGARLSGGQKQRIAIARAILKDPTVLLLDEATSALDSESERAVQQALDRLMKGRTTLVIAHRLSTVLDADRIVALDRGRIIGIGAHRQLLETSPLYARLAELQFNDRRPEVALAPGAGPA